MSSDEGRLWVSYQLGTRHLEQLVSDELFEAAGVDHADFAILSRLSAAPGNHLRMGELAAILGVPKARLTYQVTRLASQGLVTRATNLTDRRGVDASVTEAGLQLVRESGPHVIRIVRKLFLAPLSMEQRTQFQMILNALRVGLNDQSERRR